jgi:hypothetical protein
LQNEPGLAGAQGAGGVVWALPLRLSDAIEVQGGSVAIGEARGRMVAPAHSENGVPALSRWSKRSPIGRIEGCVGEFRLTEGVAVAFFGRGRGSNSGMRARSKK